MSVPDFFSELFLLGNPENPGGDLTGDVFLAAAGQLFFLFWP
jgi:hypothetical protein